jgi:PQQ-like domain
MKSLPIAICVIALTVNNQSGSAVPSAFDLTLVGHGPSGNSCGLVGYQPSPCNADQLLASIGFDHHTSSDAVAVDRSDANSIFALDVNSYDVALVDRKTKKARWRLAVPEFRRWLAIDGAVAAFEDDRGVVVVDSSTGKILSIIPPTTIVTDLQIDRGVVYLANSVCAGDQTGVAAHDATTGKQLWCEPANGPEAALTTVPGFDDNIVYVWNQGIGSDNQVAKIAALNRANGKTLWQRDVANVTGVYLAAKAKSSTGRDLLVDTLSGQLRFSRNPVNNPRKRVAKAVLHGRLSRALEKIEITVGGNKTTTDSRGRFAIEVEVKSSIVKIEAPLPPPTNHATSVDLVRPLFINVSELANPQPVVLEVESLPWPPC